MSIDNKFTKFNNKIDYLGKELKKAYDTKQEDKYLTTAFKYALELNSWEIYTSLHRKYYERDDYNERNFGKTYDWS